MQILVIQDYKENLAKCTLAPLLGARGISIVRLGHPRRSAEKVPIGPGILLAVDGRPLRREDSSLVAGGSLVLVDSTWARVRTVLDRCILVPGASLVRRSIPPGFVTAYPRASKIHDDPTGGLASVEAIFAATAVLGEPRLDLLATYRWADEFLRRSEDVLRELCPDLAARPGEGREPWVSARGPREPG